MGIVIRRKVSSKNIVFIKENAGKNKHDDSENDPKATATNICNSSTFIYIIPKSTVNRKIVNWLYSFLTKKSGFSFEIHNRDCIFYILTAEIEMNKFYFYDKITIISFPRRRWNHFLFFGRRIQLQLSYLLFQFLHLGFPFRAT